MVVVVGSEPSVDRSRHCNRHPSVLLRGGTTGGHEMKLEDVALIVILLAIMLLLGANMAARFHQPPPIEQSRYWSGL